ncbi:MAG: ATP synthase F1 subunit epsilon [Bacteroidales bacterium]|nr:ATP synthase F1 subunit epsilon [Bacteroidales bacterium]
MKVEIISPESIVYSGEADLISLPGAKGAFEILQSHAAIISSLTKGKIKVKNKEQEQFFDISGGMVECSNNKVNILVN